MDIRERWRGYVVCFQAAADKGKTAMMVALANDLVLDGYNTYDIHANMSLFEGFDGYVRHDNEGIKEYLLGFLRGKERRKVIMVTEAESVFPARFYTDKEQTKAIQKLGQMTKRESWFLYDVKLGGTMIDVLIRRYTQFSLKPEYYPDSDLMVANVINEPDLRDDGTIQIRASSVFNKYDRWEEIY